MIDAVITTTTFYPDATCPRAVCAERMVGNARQCGIPIVVVDGGSHGEFRRKISDLGAILVDEVEHPRGVMGPGRRQAIAEGFSITSGRASCYIEAEKYCMPRFVRDLFRPIYDGLADLCVPRRSSLNSYPLAQQFAEPVGNLHFRQTTGIDLDMWFGPRFFNATAGEYFLKYDDEYGGSWDPTHVPVIRCLAAKLRVLSPAIDYIHPREQTLEERDSPVYTHKRVAQLCNLMTAVEKEAQRLGLPFGR